MNTIRHRKPRRTLNPDAYRKLRMNVLERDGWRCQSCGISESLQVHHIRSRSALGDDTAENLITLCADCHDRLHLRYRLDHW
jgi:5-methylcytosine-specific restriction protein A